MQTVKSCYSSSWLYDWKNVLQIVQSTKELPEKETRKKVKDPEIDFFLSCKKECVCGDDI